MIENTFMMLNGVGEKLERRLWRSGVLTWSDFMNSEAVNFVSPGRKRQLDAELTRAGKNLKLENSAYFGRALGRRDHWRLFNRFREGAVYLDIETNGLPAGHGGYVTMVGIYDSAGFRALVRGRDLEVNNLMRELGGCKCMVTFFGSSFDIPFLEKTMPGFSMDAPHCDLCFSARRLGMTGGLKAIERRMGIIRDAETEGMDGYAAVLLWKRVLGGSREAMDLLVKYNMEDTVNLKRIAETIYAGLRAESGIEEYLA
jgi:uncharacterized protein YprB with RNaseH-like and TPR domain